MEKIKAPLSSFCVYLFKKKEKTKEKIFINFIDRNYKYDNKKLNNSDIRINDMDDIYIIYSEIPLNFIN